MAIAGVGSSDQPAGDMELTSALASLSDRVEILTASMSTVAAVRPRDAAHASDASVTVDADFMAGIVPLREALLVLEQRRVIHCENIANGNTTGYKRRQLLLTSARHEPSGVLLPPASEIGFSMAAGVLERTDGVLDIGIHGVGFFEIQLPGGERRYTRNGTFRQDINGRLVTAEGYLLTDQIMVPPISYGLSISSDGQVYARGAESNVSQIGTIRLHVFRNVTGLKATDDNDFAATVSSGPAMAKQPGIQGIGRIEQGYLERSNVDVTGELIDLQLVERQANAIRRALASHGIYTGK